MSAMANVKVKLVVVEDDKEVKSIDLPVLSGSFGARYLDIGPLHAGTGMFATDPGFVVTASCQSAITWIDGEKGKLLYRGYDVCKLADRSTFREVSFLLLHGYLPTSEELVVFERNMVRHSMVHEKLREFFQGFRVDAHPMAIMCGVMGALSSFYHDSFDIEDRTTREVSAYRIVSKMPTIAAMAYKYSIGQPFVYPDHSRSFGENFLYMMFATPCEPYKANPVFVRAMDIIFILHADHEQNASTSTVRIAASSKANPFACTAAAIASLWGPAHGGANEAVLNMLREIGNKDRIPEYLARAKDKNDTFRLMGFGHRVYKTVDPRANIMKQVCHDVLNAAGIRNDPILELAMALEKAASEDPYFIQRRLYPNVDFYSGIVFRAIGIPESMFTVIFAVGRSVGWMSHWLEMMNETTKIARPRQVYIGEEEREYNPVELRSVSRRKMTDL